MKKLLIALAIVAAGCTTVEAPATTPTKAQTAAADGSLALALRWNTLTTDERDSVCYVVNSAGGGVAADFLMAPPDALYWGPTTRSDISVFFESVC